MGVKKKRPKPTPQADSTTNSMLGTVLTGIVALLLTVRMLVPAESAEEGRTLWVVQLWLAAGLLWAWNAIRQRDYRIRLNRIDVAFWFVVIGHIVSALTVFVAGGQRRAAVNLALEWVGLGVCLFLLRQTIRTAAEARRLVGIMVAVSASLAALGLWQHYVFYPTMRQEYQQNKSELKQLAESTKAASNEDQYRRVKRRRELQAWMFSAGIPQNETGAKLFEDRLNSSEPFGMFALANTFAGVLLVWLIVSVGILIAGFNIRTQRPRWLCLAFATGLIGYCLLLTKSRTAWAGLFAGLILWAGSRLWKSTSRPARLLAYAAGVCLLLAFLLAIASLSGGFDFEVVSEAPKSLSYRLQYWTASWQMLCDQPVFGTGPGNFRQRYLQYKLPASSEEIADPHNLILDVWANGGLIAVVGMAVFLFFVVHSIRTTTPQNAAPQTTPDQGHLSPHPLTFGSLLAFLVVFAGSLLSGESYDWRIPALLAGTTAVIAICGRIANTAEIGIVCLLAALTGMLTHLLGAGGIEMPAIVQTVLVLVVAINAGQVKTDAAAVSTAQKPTGSLFAGGLFGVLFVICLLSATAPVLNCRALLLAADTAQVSGQGSEKAAELYRQAAENDPLSPEPLERLAQLYFSNWSALPGDRSREFDKAIGLQQIAIERDPHNARHYRTLGQWHLERHRRTDNTSNLQSAVASFRQSVVRYPHHAATRADFAIALGMSGRSSDAANQAEMALHQNAINQQEGHRDKYLDSNIVEQLRALTDTAKRSKH